MRCINIKYTQKQPLPTLLPLQSGWGRPGATHCAAAAEVRSVAYLCCAVNYPHRDVNKL